MKDDMDVVVLDHGTGAKKSRELVTLIAEELGAVYTGLMEDSAVVDLDGSRIAITTDSFVVEPYIFGNGDIGKIAVCGTVNDLAVMGAKPVCITLALIIEAGFRLGELRQILRSVRETAEEAGVKVVAGDTKVVRQGEADGIFINTTGVGVFHRNPLSMSDVRPGDAIILSGLIGNHSVHLLSLREGLGFETRVLSDCAPLASMLDTILSEAGSAIHSVRDVTRGGLSGVLHEFAQHSNRTIRIQRSALPIQFETRMATDMLGIDPIHLANEGCLCIFAAGEDLDRILGLLRSTPYGREAVLIGSVTSEPGGFVEAVEEDGSLSRLEELMGAELPRLC